MAERITRKHLDALCARLNRLTNSPATYRDEAGNILIGHWHISGGYGGFSLHRTENDCGGISSPISGHVHAGDLYERMHAFIKGIEFVQHGE